MRTYRVKEIFYSLQGEGARAGSANVFVRFAGCNLDCRRKTHGFDCDTDWKGGDTYSATEIEVKIRDLWPGTQPSVILTGGEPLLQADGVLRVALKGMFVAVETNGTIPVPEWIDYVAVSPKRGESFVIGGRANELRLVVDTKTTVDYLDRVLGQVPLTCPVYLSPAFAVREGPAHQLEAEEDRIQFRENLKHAIQLCLDRPTWRLSVQQHKQWGVR